MSPKVAFAILLLSCVLLGIANAQPPKAQRPGAYNHLKVAPRNTGFTDNIPPYDDGAFNPECMPNQLASNTVDNKKPRAKH